MPEVVQFHLVDAFAQFAYGGNPAGVVLDADKLDKMQMQQIAREINASETAFVCGLNDLHEPPKLRWFSPSAEVSFCGHATLAAAHAWSEALGMRAVLGKPDVRIEFQTPAGLLTLTPEILSKDKAALIWWLAMPDPELKPDNTNPMKMTHLLGFDIDDLESGVPIMRTRDNDVILLVNSWRVIMEMEPNFQALAELSRRHKIRGFCVATLETLNEFVHVVSRFFAPAIGINEDPVTGSVHGPLAVLLTVNELVPMLRGGAALNCIQGQPGGRTGLVRTLVKLTPKGYRVSIGGMCYTTIRGELCAPSE